MKNYFRPHIKIRTFEAIENVATLTDWLSQNELTDAGITTYVVNS